MITLNSNIYFHHQIGWICLPSYASPASGDIPPMLAGGMGSKVHSPDLEARTTFDIVHHHAQ
ncbi:MAG: hypothetical protein KAW89_06075, partial [Armatimonadetes bacterium]|nr:hypothetical protein [Armatimonadota bacterium]